MLCTRASLLALAFALATVASPALALTYEPVADAALTDQAAVVVRAQVLDAQAREIGGRIVTDYALSALETLKGESGSVLTVRALGGQLDDGRGLALHGVPRFAQGEELLLFLVPHGDVYRVLHIAQGAFFSAYYGGERYWLRALDGGLAVPAKDGGREAAVTGARHADRFAAWVADRAAGKARAADYAVAGVPPLAELRPRAKFTLLGDDNNPIRWFEFDSRRTLTWFRHAEGQPGVGDGGLAAFSRARQAWNREPNSPVRLIDGGTTSSTTGFESSDRRNTIIFSDLPDAIDSDFDCSSGGTLAIGGISFILSNDRRPWKDRRFRVAFEAEIIMNTGIQCRFRGQPLLLEQIYTHELGHTLGLGHSCGDDDSPSCTGNLRLARAVMTASARAPFRGAVLQADDIDGIRFLYDPDFLVDGPCSLPPGHPRLCTDCGPCGDGEGDCDNDAECLPGLSCVDNIGADFGFPPGIDICRGGGPRPPPPTPDDCGLLFPPGDPKFCDADKCGPCSAGQGDCDRDSDCIPGLICADNVGADFGFNPGIDVCISDGTCNVAPGKRFFCATCGPCGAGEGDCDSDADCRAGLTCVEDVGAQHGFGAKVDVCL